MHLDADDLLADTCFERRVTFMETNPEIDYAIQKISAVNNFLCQGTDEKYQFDEEIELLRQVFND